MEFLRPTLLLDTEKCLSNLYAMISKAEHSKVRLRPHCKTHQSTKIAQWCREAGIKQITVSSVSMAKYFAEDGWQDITIAFPLNISEIELLNDFSNQVKLNILITNTEAIQKLTACLKRPLGYYIKIDTGYHRCGYLASETTKIEEILTLGKHNTLLEFKGFLSHFGNTYQARGTKQVREIYTEGVEQLSALKKEFSVEYPDLEISVGDTPSSSLLTDMMDVTEIRPGNFIFYDIMQEQIGSCSFDQIAVALACPVIDVHPERNEAVIYGGAVHLSKDYIIDINGDRNYGAIAVLENGNWKLPLTGCYVKSLSQEHGIIHLPDNVKQLFKPGKWIAVIPAHSCLTADAMGYYITNKGERIEMMDRLI